MTCRSKPPGAPTEPSASPAPGIAEILTLDDLAKAYPSRAAAIGPKACEEEIMADNPKVLLLNRSR